MDRSELPNAWVDGSGKVHVTPGTYDKAKPLPIVGGMLQTKNGPIRVAGQLMSAEGPQVVSIQPRDTPDFAGNGFD